MSCINGRGVQPIVRAIEEETGVKLTQTQWHTIKKLAQTEMLAEIRKQLETELDDPEEIEREIQRWERGFRLDGGYWEQEDTDALAKTIGEDKGYDEDQWEYLVSRSLEDEMNSGYDDDPDFVVTHGTKVAVHYLAKHGLYETLKKIEDDREAAKAAKAAEKAAAAAEAEKARQEKMSRESDVMFGRVTKEDLAPPAEFVGRDWAPDVYWPNVPEEDREAFGWAMDSNSLTFYEPALGHYDAEGWVDDYENYSHTDAALPVAQVLKSLPADASDDDVISALSTTPLGNHYYLADDGGNHPALTVWEEWQANGPRS